MDKFGIYIHGIAKKEWNSALEKEPEIVARSLNYCLTPARFNERNQPVKYGGNKDLDRNSDIDKVLINCERLFHTVTSTRFDSWRNTL